MPKVSVHSRCAVPAALSLVLAAGSAASAQSLPNGVAAGDTTATSAVLWTHSTALGNVTFQWSTDPNFATLAGSQTVAVTNADIPVRADVQGLAPGTQYYYRAVNADSTAAAGQFRTFANPGASTGSIRFGVSGDWRGEVAPYPAARNIPGRNLDFFVALGDTIYADYPTPDGPFPQAQTLDQFRSRHNEVYRAHNGLSTLADVRASTNWFAMIDDHEVTNDFAGYEPAAGDPRFSFGNPAPGTPINRSPLFTNGVQAFREYNPIRGTNYSTPGNDRFDGVADLYRARSFGHAGSFFVVDARSFRDQELESPTSLDPAQVGPFIAGTYNPARTMLGNVQVQRLEQDLMASVSRGETWRFIMLPEPAQNLGVAEAGDRYEGYAAERSALLGFIHEHNIPNVVFVSADIHGTVVNNLTYATAPGAQQIATSAWEITTGSLGFDAPFGPTVASLAAGLGVPGVLPLDAYLALPAAQQEQYIQGLVNLQLLNLGQGYDPIGLDGSDLPFNLLTGDWTVTNAYSWTEFDVDAATGMLTVTTYGTPWYSAEFAALHPDAVAALQPTILQQFTMMPQAVPTSGAVALLGMTGLVVARRRR